MAYIYECKIKIHSVIDNLDEQGLAEGDPEINIITVPGFLKVAQSTMELSYVESTEESRTTVDMRLTPQRVELSRRGSVVCDMIFDESEPCRCIYSIPPYSFDMSINTKKIRSSLCKSGGDLQLIYSMNVGGQEKRVRMKISVEVL